jgi:hypothetical protein
MTPSIHVGLEGFTLPDLDPFDLVELAAQAGYSHAGVRLIDPATNSATLTVDEGHRLRELAHARGIGLHGGDIVDLEGPEDAWTECFATLAAGGITRVSSFHRGTDVKAASRRFGDWVARGGEYAVTPYLEPVSYFGVSSIGIGAEMVAEAGGGGITLDTLHFGRAGDDLGLLADLARTIPLWLRVCDGPPMEELVPPRRDPRRAHRQAPPQDRRPAPAPGRRRLRRWRHRPGRPRERAAPAPRPHGRGSRS